MSFKRFATAGMPDRYRCGCHKHCPPWPGCDGYGRGCDHPGRKTMNQSGRQVDPERVGADLVDRPPLDVQPGRQRGALRRANALDTLEQVANKINETTDGGIAGLLASCRRDYDLFDGVAGFQMRRILEALDVLRVPF